MNNSVDEKMAKISAMELPTLSSAEAGLLAVSERKASFVINRT